MRRRAAVVGVGAATSAPAAASAGPLRRTQQLSCQAAAAPTKPGPPPPSAVSAPTRAAVAAPPPASPAAAAVFADNDDDDANDDAAERAAAAAAPAPSPRDDAAAPLALALAPADSSAAPLTWWDNLTSKVSTPRFRALAMLNAMTLLLGTNWVVLKYAAIAGVSGPAVDPQTFTAMRFALATAAFSPWLLKGFADRAVVRAGAELGAWCAAGYIAQAVALSMTPASRASLLSTFTVLIVPAFAAAGGQRIRPFVWGCAGAAVAGTLLLEAGSSEPPNIGDAWAILSAAAFAGQLFRAEVLTRDLPPSSSLPLMAVSMAVIAGMTAGVAGVADWRDAASTAVAVGNMAGGVADVLASGHPLGAPHAAGLLAAGELAFTAWLSTALALLLELIALKDVSSTEAALVYSMEPLVGASLSCLFLGERFGPTGMAGAAIILVSSVASQMTGAGGGGAPAEGAVGGGGKGGGGGRSA